MTATSCHFPDDETLWTLIKGRVEEPQTTGITLGVLEPGAPRRVFAYGNAGRDAGPLRPESVFEIGSVTKVFTGILLADMAARGEVDLTAPAQRYAPSGLILPTIGGWEITLTDLAAHRSGLPRLPANLILDNPDNPHAAYSVAQMYEFLANYQLTREIGSEYEYSNLGMGLLGHLLAARAGVDYESLVRHRILEPLGMTMTGIALSPAMKKQLAIGHNLEGQPTPLWDLPTLGAAGALRSNLNDMLTFLEANIGEPRNDLERAMRVSHRPEGSTQISYVGLAWHILPAGHDKIVFHDGGTGGYRSMIGFNPNRRVGVVSLTNSARNTGDLALHLLNRAIPLARLPIAHTASRTTKKVR